MEEIIPEMETEAVTLEDAEILVVTPSPDHIKTEPGIMSFEVVTHSSNYIKTEPGIEPLEVSLVTPSPNDIKTEPDIMALEVITSSSNDIKTEHGIVSFEVVTPSPDEIKTEPDIMALEVVTSIPNDIKIKPSTMSFVTISTSSLKKKYPCCQCKTVFRTYHQLYWHKKRRTDCQKLLTVNHFYSRGCVRCKKTFTDAIVFRKHIVDCFWKNNKMAVQHLKDSDDSVDIENRFTNQKMDVPKATVKLKAKGPPKKSCEKCGIRFRSSTHYVQHMRRKNFCRLPPYKCLKCDKVFKKLYNLMSHEKRKNSCQYFLSHGGHLTYNEDIKDCEKRGKNVNHSTNYQEHLQTEKECGVLENTKVDAKNENDEIENDKPVKKTGFHQCKECFKVFPHLYRLKYHQNRKTPCNPNSPLLTASNSSDVKRSTRKVFPPVRFEPDTSLKPSIEFSTLSSSDSKSVSKKTVTKPVLKKPKEVTDTSIPEVTVTTSSNRQLICEECNKSFTSTSAWYKHGRRYHYEESMRPVKCPDCNLSFQTKYLLLGHQRKAQHWGKGHCICPFCQRQFASYKMRNTHVRNTHKPNRSHKVKEFLLLRTCQLCSKEFMDPASKDLHMKMQHKDVPSVADCVDSAGRSTEVKSGIVCMQCKLIFETKELFTAHIPRCPSKKKNKNTNSSLLIQSKTDGVSPTIFVCEDCGMTFTTKHHFSAHQNRFCRKKNQPAGAEAIKANQRGRGILSIENGKFTFVCSLCKMKFTSRFQYSLHARRYCPMKNKRAGLKLIFRPLALKAKEAENDRDVLPVNGALQTKKREHAIKRSWQPTLKAKQKYEDDFARARTQSSTVVNPLDIASKVKRRAQTFQKPWKLALKAKKRAQISRKYLLTCNYCSFQFSSLKDYREHDCNEFISDKAETSAQQTVSEASLGKERSIKKPRRFYTRNRPDEAEAEVITSSISSLMKKYPTSCPFCRRKYCNSYVRDRHLRLHTLDRSFFCEFCGERYLRSEYLTKHLQVEHNDALKFECVKCGMRYPTKLHCHHHISKMHKLPFTDDLVLERDMTESCSSMLMTEDYTESIKKRVQSRANPELPSSILRVGGNVPGRGLFSCELCQVGTFAKMSTLKNHLKSKLHQENLRNCSKTPNENFSDNRSITCSMCNQSFAGIETFVPHRLSHFNNKNVDPTEISEINPYTCEICFKEYSHYQRVQAHLLWHLRAARTPNASRPAKGPVNLSAVGFEKRSPSETFHSSPTKDGPAKKSIGGGSPSKLQKTFPQPDHDQDNALENFYDCRLCSESFPDLQHYEEHACLKSFSCPNCGQHFSNMRGLSVHKNKWCKNKVKSGGSNVKKSYFCKRCNQKKMGGEKHVCSKQLKCPYCEIMFINRRGLGVHVVKWCKKKPTEELLTCRYCSLIFSSTDDVGWHEKSCRKVQDSENTTCDKNEQKQLQCRFCNEIFVSCEFLSCHEKECIAKPSAEKSEDHYVQCLVCNEILTDSLLVEAHSTCHPGDVSLICTTCSEIMNLPDASQHVRKQFAKLDSFHDNLPELFTGSEKNENTETHDWNSKVNSTESNSSFELETVIIHSPKLGKLYQCIYCRKLYRDTHHLKAHLVVHKPFLCQVCGQKENTTRGYQLHPCRLPDGSYATGIQHRKHWTSFRNNTINIGNNLHAVTSDVCPPNASDQSLEVAEQEKKASSEVEVVCSPPAKLGSNEEEALDNLRENFSQLLFLLVADADLMSTLGWGKKLVDLVLDDVLVHLGQDPVKEGKAFSTMERLRKNILSFLQLCIKDDVLTSVGAYSKSIEVVVRDMLHVCTDGLQENAVNGTETSSV